MYGYVHDGCVRGVRTWGACSERALYRKLFVSTAQEVVYEGRHLKSGESDDNVAVGRILMRILS